MKKTSFVFALLAFCLTLPSGAQTSTPSVRSAKTESSAQVSPTPASRSRTQTAATEKPAQPEATPAAPRKRSFWDWILFRRNKAPKPEPAPNPEASPAAATPTPEKAPRAKATPEKEQKAPAPSPAVTPASTPAAVQKTQAASTPASTPEPVAPAQDSKTSDDNLTATVPFVPEATPEPAAPFPTVDEAKEREKYKAAKEKALEDKSILALQEKADTATGDAQQRAASRAYYKALYQKMREIDPSLKERIDRMEIATLRRLKAN